ncbi:unnamed protein product [Mortierella alpina]
MRLSTIAVASLVAATAYAGTATPECAECIRAVEGTVQGCLKLFRFSIGFDFADRISTFEPQEKKCICTVVGANKWVNACKDICPADWTDLLYSRFETAKTQCVGVPTEVTDPSSPKPSTGIIGVGSGTFSAASSLTSSSGAALLVAAAVAQAFV